MTTMRTITCFVLVGMTVLAAPAAAQDKTQLTVAIFAPNAPFAGGDARYAYVQRLASHIGNVAGVQTRGQAFARVGDFEAAVRKGTVDFAVVDPVYLATRGAAKVLAMATVGGRTVQSWGLFVSGATPNVLALKGKRIVYAHASSRDLAFIENAMLDGEVSATKFFGARQTTPDIASAVAAVAMGKADCVLAPQRQAEGKGLRRIFDAGTVPSPAFVQLSKKVPDAVAASVAKAVLGFGAGGALDGWKPGNAEVYRGLAGRMGARGRKAAMSEPELVRLESQEILLLGKIEPVLPPLEDYYWSR